MNIEVINTDMSTAIYATGMAAVRALGEATDIADLCRFYSGGQPAFDRSLSGQTGIRRAYPYTLSTSLRCNSAACCQGGKAIAHHHQLFPG